MTYTEARIDNRVSHRQPRGVALKKLRSLFAAFAACRQAATRRASMKDLTADQLEDIGYADAPRPRLEVKAGLVTNLMSMM